MHKKVVFIFILFNLGFYTEASTSNKEATVVSAHATNATSKAVFEFLNGNSPLLMSADQQFSKLELILQKKVRLTGISIESCGEPFSDGIDFYLNFDENYKFLEGGKKLMFYNFLETNRFLDVAAIVINFKRNAALCLKKITLISADGPLAVKAPRVLSAKVEVAAGLNDYQKLFDSKLSSFAKVPSPEPPTGILVKWNREQEVDQLMLWPGNFTDELQFKKYARPEYVELSCDRKIKENLIVKNQMIPQILKLPTVFKCRTLGLFFKSNYAGAGTQELAISEIRFLNGDDVFQPDLSQIEQQAQARVRAKFTEANLTAVIEHQLLSVETSRPSMLRLHADASFFLRGFDELANENESFYVLGEMSVIGVRKNRIKLMLRGIKRSSTLEMDSLSCGRKCFQESDFSNEKYFFEQQIQVRKGRDGFYRIDTLSAKKFRRIDFTSVRFLLDHSL